jgi:hypothetical protein
MFLFFGLQKKTVSLVPRFLLTHAAVLHFFLYKSTPLGDGGWITVELSPEFSLIKKKLIRASQIAAHKTPSAPESPL